MYKYVCKHCKYQCNCWYQRQPHLLLPLPVPLDRLVDQGLAVRGLQYLGLLAPLLDLDYLRLSSSHPGHR